MKFKSISKVLCIAISSLMLIGCGGSKKEDSRIMEEAKIAFASKEYDKAEGILKLAAEEKKDKEAKELYEQVKAYRAIVSKVDSLNIESNLFGISFEEAIKGLYSLYDNLKIIEENKTKSTLVTNELEKYIDEIRINTTELINLYNEYLRDKKIEKAKPVLEHIKTLENYKLEALSDYEFNIKELEKSLKEAEEKSKIDSSNVNGYSAKDIDKILQDRFSKIQGGGACIIEGQEEIINGELCYEGNASWNNGNRVRGFYVGSFSGKVYNDRKDQIGDLKTFEIYELE